MALTGDTSRAQGDGAGGLKNITERKIETSGVTWQALAAVMDGMDDEEAAERLEALTPEELRVFHFQLDRIRTLTRNIRFRKMREQDEAAKGEHEAGVKKPGEGER